ncbi:MAG: hypothetical protein NDF53_04185 [archaeon GB-1867-097]|nr:hypothetical protein [Candidatus Verstraetearchaeota archaeon]MCS7384911.1 hypothetical protein [Candidatus Culexmicrobium thermophilum]RLE53862.1 MAG: hypothetical protein DRJ30_06255 [Candidatus Verstraetearchaeota archaeon]
MRSYIKLYGPSIERGLRALDSLMERLDRSFEYGDIVAHIISVVEPSIDLKTGKHVGKGRVEIGEYDYVIEWKQRPTKEQIFALIRRIDEALLYTGCRYSIVTKE